MRNSYYTSTVITRVPVPEVSGTKAPSVLFTNVLSGKGVQFNMNTVITGNKSLTEISKLPYAKAERFKIFQPKNIVSTTVPEELRNVPNLKDINVNYEKDIIG